MSRRIAPAVATAASFGFAMHLAARLAGDPNRDWIQWVVNWGALWVIPPFLGGRRSDRATTAVLLGALIGAIEVITYYGVENLAVFKIAWIGIGAGFSGLAGALGLVSSRHRLGLLGLPTLMVLAPLGLAAVFLLLGRGLGSQWLRSGLAEVVGGVVACTFVTLRQARPT